MQASSGPCIGSPQHQESLGALEPGAVLQSKEWPNRLLNAIQCDLFNVDNDDQCPEV